VDALFHLAGWRIESNFGITGIDSSDWTGSELL